MRLSELSASDLKFLEQYEANYREFNTLSAFGNMLTEKGKKEKKKAHQFITDNLSKYMELTN